MPVDAATFEQGDERYSIENEIVHFLQDNRERAYNVREITLEVMETGWSEANIESSSFEEYVGCFLDLATVSSILDALVDDGRAKRRILDTGQGERSYYRAP
jgi:hypothetical protein